MKWGLVLFVCIMGLTASFAEAKKVPEIRCLDQKAFEVLKKNLGIDDPDISRTEVLEIIALSYAAMFERVQGNIVDLDRRAGALEKESKNLRSDTDELKRAHKELKERVDGIDADVTKIFDCYNKLNDEVRNEFQVGGIAYKLKQLRDDVASDIDAHAQSIEKNQRNIQQNAAAIQSLDFAIRSLRLR